MLILAILNDGTILTISKDRVQPSPYPNSWNLSEIFTYAIVYGIYLAASTVVFFSVAVKTSFFQDKFGVQQFAYRYNDQKYPGWNDPILHSIIYLQVSTISQALIFVTRSRSFFFLERPSLILVFAFMVAQMIATFIAVYANWGFTGIHGCGWHWAGIVWIWNIVWFFPLDFVKVSERQREWAVASLLSFSLLSVPILTQYRNEPSKRYWPKNHLPKNNELVVRVPLVVDLEQLQSHVVPQWVVAKVSANDETHWPTQPPNTMLHKRNICLRRIIIVTLLVCWKWKATKYRKYRSNTTNYVAFLSCR